MKIFLSALEQSTQSKGEKTSVAEVIVQRGIPMHYNLMSYFYVRQGDKRQLAAYIRDHTEEIMIDSGAHSLQKGAKVKFDKYTQEYAEFIQRFDRPNVVGFFEMDIDNIVGYPKVLEYRRVLESVSDKIIPVWHKNRGVREYVKMCQQYSGKVVAITGFKNEDVRDDQYLSFVKTARKYGCKIHCLGMTRKEILDKVPFDYTDSSTWKMCGFYGRLQKQKSRMSSVCTREKRTEVTVYNYRLGVAMQEHYHDKWRKVCND